MIYFLTYYLTKLLSLIFFPRRVIGKNHIPKSGAFILASNHISNLDPPILGISTSRHLYYMAKVELFKNPVFGWWLKQLWAFPVKRGEGDIAALKYSLSVLKKGYPLLLFPEGTRRPNGHQELKPQPGAGFLVLKAKVPVVPVYIQGSDQVMPPGSKFFKRSNVKIIIGEPIVIDQSLSNEEASMVILQRIYELK